jgi:fimbrial chaperone protein
MRSRGRSALRAGLLAGLWLMGGPIAVGPAVAIGLQVAPVELTLTAGRPADGLWLSNTSSDVIHAQVRVFHWTQDGGADTLTASRGLVVSPPMLTIPAGQRQLVRVIRTGAPPMGVGAHEDTYRILVDELPVPSLKQTGVNFVVRFSLPIFVTPAGKLTPKPELDWSLHRVGGHAVLEVANRGNGHAQLAKVTFVDRAGRRSELTPGLLGYALAGQTMRWTLKPTAMTFDGGGTLEVQLNGQTISVPIAPPDGSR